MPFIQQTYSERQPAGYIGFVANMETANSITRTVEETNGIPFGVPTVRGTTDRSVLLPLSLSYTAAAAARAGNTGNATITASPAISAGARAGTITVTALSATSYRVEDAEGVVIGEAVAGTPFTGGGVTFTITSGGTPMVVGDGFNVVITATAGGGQYQGVTIADPTLVQAVSGNTVSPVDTYQKGNNVALATMDVIFVQFGATVNAGQTAYFNTTTKRWTNVNTDFAVPRARFEDSGVDGDIKRIRLFGQ